MSKPYTIIFTDEAKAAAEAASLTLAQVEAQARREIAGWIEDMDLPSWGFCAIDMPDGTKFVALYGGPDLCQIDAVTGTVSVGRIEDKNPELAEAFGVSGEVVFPSWGKK
jgi:hypothetical protein